MCQALRIIDFAAHVWQSQHLRLAELLGPVQAVEDEAGGLLRIGIRLAVGVKGNRTLTVFQEGSALRGTEEVDPVRRIAPTVEKANLYTALHTSSQLRHAVSSWQSV